MINRTETTRTAPATGRGAALRPREAAALLLISREGPRPSVLVGRRSSAHVFMPDVYVFPGGRRDPGDHRLPYAADLSPAVSARLRQAGLSGTRARALALTAVREMHEETGLAVGRPHAADGAAESGLLPFLADLGHLRYVARAVTPPGHPRRFDTHFFALFADEAGIDPAGARDSRELSDLRLLPIDDPSGIAVPEITRTVLAALGERLLADPSLGLDAATPYFHVRHGRFIRDLL